MKPYLHNLKVDLYNEQGFRAHHHYNRGPVCLDVTNRVLYDQFGKMKMSYDSDTRMVSILDTQSFQFEDVQRVFKAHNFQGFFRPELSNTRDAKGNLRFSVVQNWSDEYVRGSSPTDGMFDDD